MGNDSSKESSPRYQRHVPTRTHIDSSTEAINYTRDRVNEIIRQRTNAFRPSPQPPPTQPNPSTTRQQTNAFRPSPQPPPTQPNPSTTRTHTYNYGPSPQPAPTQRNPSTGRPTTNPLIAAPTQPNPSTGRPTINPLVVASTQPNPSTGRPTINPLVVASTQPNPSTGRPTINPLVVASTQPNPSTESSNIERERNPYSFSRQQLSNTNENKTSLYPNLNECSPNGQNSDSMRNGYVLVNSPFKEGNSPGREEPTAPSESLMNERQGRGAVPKQRPPRSSQFNSDQYKCRTCKRIFGTEIYQCQNGHSSCGNCKQNNRQCGDCRSYITETRNYALQDLLTDMGMKPTAPISESCPNAKAGCTLRFKPSEAHDHLKECPFQDIDCPVHHISKRCNWIGKQKDITAHFEDCHPEHLQGDVNKELYLSNIVNDERLLYLIKIGPFNFLIHIKVCSREKNIYMVAQFLGTKFSAQKWSFELHVYNKREPRRKYLYNDICRAINESADDIFRVNDCAILPLAYAMTFVNEGCIAFKFFIKKKNDDEDEPRGREHSRNRLYGRNNNFNRRKQQE